MVVVVGYCTGSMIDVDEIQFPPSVLSLKCEEFAPSDVPNALSIQNLQVN